MPKQLLHFFVFLFGLAVLFWVGGGYVLEHNPLAAGMTGLIAIAYLTGGIELWRFQRATTGMQSPLQDAAGAQGDREAWLQRFPAGLRTAVRLRLDGERVALPMPVLSGYLVGLLVLLGMLGTLLGMLATLRGTGMALQSATDLDAIRASLAAPVKGLGFAFGTSIAGVASSAMLGLLSALCRRDRLHAVHQLDGLIAGILGPGSRRQREQQTLQLLQQQVEAMPVLIERLQVLASTVEQQQQAGFAQQLQDQQTFQRQHADAQLQLASRLQQALQEGIAGHAQASQSALREQSAAVLQAFALQAGQLQQQQVQDIGHQFTAWTQAQQQAMQANAQAAAERMQQLLMQVQQAQADQLTALHAADEQRLALLGQAQQQVLAEFEHCRQREIAQLQEHNHALAEQRQLLEAVQRTADAQHAAVVAAASQSTEVLERIGDRVEARLAEEADKLDAATAQVTASVLEVAGLGDAFEHAMQLFGAHAGTLGERLQQIESALAQAQVRNDEQLAYYVAQAREVVELSLLSQRQIIGELQQLPARRGVPA